MQKNKMLLEQKGSLTIQFEELKRKTALMEASLEMDHKKNSVESQKLEQMLACSGDMINDLLRSKEKLEVTFLVLKSKLDEQCHHITNLENGCNDELEMVQGKCNELTQRLSEQTLKTEDFMDLSIHLKELKDKSEPEYRQAQEKREQEEDTLRVDFVKEQYETKLQKMKQQLSISKRHSEEMRWKLQDAIDDIENRKRCDVSQLKIIEELKQNISKLEEKLNSSLSEKCEIQKAYDLVKAEKECSSISLECCKEEKLELEVSLQKCRDEKSQLAGELNLMKDLLETPEYPVCIGKEDRGETASKNCITDGPLPEKVDLQNQNSKIICQGRTNKDIVSENSSTMDSSIESNNSSPCLDELQQVKQDVLLSKDDNEGSCLKLANSGGILNGDPTFSSRSFKSSLDLLNEGLEKMKMENSNPHHYDKGYDSDRLALLMELIQFQKVNEKLQSLVPSFNDFPGSGNALERVLALEIELAEALQGKNKRAISFQSSFLKQHGDEEAVFRSFRDINELI